MKVGAREPGGTAVEAGLELIVRRGLRVRVRRGFDRELLCELLAALQPPDSPEASG